MADVIDFPEKRNSIPVNLPDIGCIETMVCDRHPTLRIWTIMALPDGTPYEARCAAKECDNRILLIPHEGKVS